MENKQKQEEHKKIHYIHIFGKIAF